MILNHLLLVFRDRAGTKHTLQDPIIAQMYYVNFPMSKLISVENSFKMLFKNVCV